MGAVGGSRHYTGGGLGDERGWSCPACGAENLGLIAEGCQVCGAGTPGQHHDGPPPAPPRVERTPELPATEPDEGPEHLGAFDRWALTHPKATLEQAYIAGYIEGVRDARRGIRPPVMAAATVQNPEDRMNRTIRAALELFRDQVLVAEPEEIATGEWMSVEEVNELLRELRAREEEAAHV